MVSATVEYMFVGDNDGAQMFVDALSDADGHRPPSCCKHEVAESETVSQEDLKKNRIKCFTAHPILHTPPMKIAMLRDYSQLTWKGYEPQHERSHVVPLPQYLGETMTCAYLSGMHSRLQPGWENLGNLHHAMKNRTTACDENAHQRIHSMHTQSFHRTLQVSKSNKRSATCGSEICLQWFNWIFAWPHAY